jgi:predicted CXXCH cytochrome family protein
VSILLAARLSPQADWTPEHFWRQESAYAGSRACNACHPGIYKRQQASNHARSLRPPKEVIEIVSRLPLVQLDQATGAQLELRRRAGGELELVARKDGVEQALRLQWVFGSGVKGITPVGQRADGQFAESRLSWYASLRGFDITTGATGQDPRTAAQSLGRSLSRNELLECFGCHSTRPAPDQPAPEADEMGIRCERCHGPGMEHIRAVQDPGQADKKIFQPGRLDGFAQAQFCGVCHGRPPQDTDFRAIRFIEQSPHTARFPSQRLVLSRCFNETDGGIRCTQCHDPHGNVSGKRAAYEKVCVSCHRIGASAHAKVCSVAHSDCSACHMPKQQVMAHSLFTDHWIRVVRADERK